MERCADCDSVFKNKNSLRSHKSSFHRSQPPSTENTTAIVNNYKHKDKELMSLDSTSGDSSTSDESIRPEFDSELDEGLEIVDEYNKYDEVDRYIKHLRHKRRHVSDSSDEEPESKVHRNFLYIGSVFEINE